MKIFSAEQIREWDAYTIANEPISSVDLMERASNAFCNWFTNRYPKEKNIEIFCGPGNNGGDGLAISRILFLAGYKVETYIVVSEYTSADFRINEKRLLDCYPVHPIHSTDDIPEINAPVIIDALFGSGLKRPIQGIFAEVVRRINTSKREIISVDIASGLFCDSLNEDHVIVKPDFTVSFQLPKLSFFLSQNEPYVGTYEVINIGLHEKYGNEVTADYSLINEELIRTLIPKRPKYSHKGTYGTALIVAGSYGMMGAAVLASKACLRTGVGLCVSYVPECGYEIMQISVPENMVLTDREQKRITSVPELEKYDAIGIGPGLGKASETKTALHHLLTNATCPLVIDADALNIISENKSMLKDIPAASILTPHPKEFARLAGESRNDYERLEKLKKFSQDIKSVVVLKGANTAVAIPDGRVYFNTNGNSGMATGGSGDVLTGIITSLLAQGYSSEHAAIVGVYLHGYAGDKAALKHSQASMIASDIIESMADFFKKYTT